MQFSIFLVYRKNKTQTNAKLDLKSNKLVDNQTLDARISLMLC